MGDRDLFIIGVAPADRDRTELPRIPFGESLGCGNRSSWKLIPVALAIGAVRREAVLLAPM